MAIRDDPDTGLPTPVGDEPPEDADTPPQPTGNPTGKPTEGPTEEPPEEPGTGELELRVALAMRGGVSLAVWIGGVIAELDLARRAMAGLPPPGGPGDAGPAGRAEAYAALLRSLGYSSVTFDVLAGASAGGLNSVI